jgi:hypothetical protein
MIAQFRDMNCSLFDLMTLCAVQFSSNGKMAVKEESNGGSCGGISAALS